METMNQLSHTFFFIATWKKNKRQSLVWAVLHHLVSLYGHLGV